MIQRRSTLEYHKQPSEKGSSQATALGTPKNCNAINAQACPYHGVTLVCKEYRDLLIAAKHIATELTAMQTIVNATNMNPEVLLKDLRQKEQNLISRIDSTPEGIAYLTTLTEQYKDDVSISDRLTTRKRIGTLLANKRQELSTEIEAHKREWLPTIRGKEARVFVLNQYLQNKVNTLRGATEQFSDIESNTTYHTATNLALIEELEEVQVVLRPNLT